MAMALSHQQAYNYKLAFSQPAVIILISRFSPLYMLLCSFGFVAVMHTILSVGNFVSRGKRD